MTEPIYVGIDNGVSGSIGIVGIGREPLMLHIPVKKELSYTKAKRFLTRVDWKLLRDLFWQNLIKIKDGEVRDVRARNRLALVNPTRFQATSSALRALEATLIVLEAQQFPVQYVDSREWQRIMLPSGLKGAGELKKASADVGRRMFPNLRAVIDKQGDADGLLMAEWARRERR